MPSDGRPAGAVLQASEETFRLLFAGNPQPMWIYDLETLAFLDVNEAALAQYGYTRAEFLGLRLVDIRPEEERARLVAHVQQSRPALQHSGVWQHRRKDGTLIDVEITSHTLTLAGRAAVLVIARDVTAHRRAEAALRASEERLRTVVSNAPIVLLAVDRDGVFTLAEGHGLEMLDIRPGEQVGRSYFELFSAQPDSVAALKRALAGEAVTSISAFRELVFEMRWVPTRDAEGAISGAIGVFTDITERRRAAEERRRLERRSHDALAALVAMAEASVVVAEDSTPEGRDSVPAQEAGERLAELTRQVLDCRHVAIVAVAPGTEELRGVAIAGFGPDEVPGWWRQWESRPRLHERLAAPDLVRLRADEVLILDRTRMPFPRETAFGRHTVLMVPLRAGDTLAGVMSVDHGGQEHTYTPDEIALVRAAGRLVTLVLERERLLHERAEAQAHVLALREANRRMEEFLSIAGHELRTPLTSVLGNMQLSAKWVDMMQLGAAAGAPFERLALVQMVLRRMERQGRVLNRLVNDLLDTSRIQLGRLALRPAPCDLVAIVRDAVQEYQQQAPQRTLRLDTAAVALPVVADAARLAQVLSNYLSNALKYSPPGQPITVGLRVTGAEVRVWVQDHGPGLPDTEHDRIWERFYRVADMAHQDGSSEGLGLGLHISRNIVERHGGRVGVEGAPGAGATFWFTIPLAQPDDGGSGVEGDDKRPDAGI